jgi:hypothetical protein
MAVSAAYLRSQAKASDRPAPAAGPGMRAMVGFGIRHSFPLVACWFRRCRSRFPPPSPAEPRSTSSSSTPAHRGQPAFGRQFPSMRAAPPVHSGRPNRHEKWCRTIGRERTPLTPVLFLWSCRESNPGPTAFPQGFSVRSSLCLYSDLPVTRTSRDDDPSRCWCPDESRDRTHRSIPLADARVRVEGAPGLTD